MEKTTVFPPDKSDYERILAARAERWIERRKRKDPRVLLERAREAARTPENRAARRSAGRKIRADRQRERTYAAYLRPKDLARVRRSYAGDASLREIHETERDWIEGYIYSMDSVGWPRDRKGRFTFDRGSVARYSARPYSVATEPYTEPAGIDFIDF